MFTALQGKSQFKIKVIQISCSHVKNFVVIGHEFTRQNFDQARGGETRLLIVP